MCVECWQLGLKNLLENVIGWVVEKLMLLFDKEKQKKKYKFILKNFWD